MLYRHDGAAAPSFCGAYSSTQMHTLGSVLALVRVLLCTHIYHRQLYISTQSSACTLVECAGKSSRAIAGCGCGVLSMMVLAFWPRGENNVLRPPRRCAINRSVASWFGQTRRACTMYHVSQLCVVGPLTRRCVDHVARSAGHSRLSDNMCVVGVKEYAERICVRRPFFGMASVQPRGCEQLKPPRAATSEISFFSHTHEKYIAHMTL